MIALNGFSAGAMIVAVEMRNIKLLLSSLFLFIVTLVEIHLELRKREKEYDRAEDIEVV